MGNGLTRLSHCLGPPFRRRRRRHHVSPAALLPSDQFDDSLGHSFCYVRSSAPSHCLPSFPSISGAAVSANASTPPSTSLFLSSHSATTTAATTTSTITASSFESSVSFASIPLQPTPLSGPLPSDRPFMSGPLDRAAFLSGPLNPASTSPPRSTLSRSRSVLSGRRKSRPGRHVSALIRSLASSLSFTKEKSLPDDPLGSGADDFPMTSGSSSVEWAQGRAGEDRVHVVVSEEHGWVFVGIYDGFNGPDATDFLLSNLYPMVHLQLEGILWQENEEEEEEVSEEKKKKRPSGKSRGRDRKTRHVEVLKALSRALRKTEEAYLSTADNMLDENPELALMGSCVLVMLMKGEDVYLMNVGDSRAVLATKSGRDLEGINEDLLNDFSGFLPSLSALQLTFDHSTCAEEEVIRIRNEHPDDPTAIANDRVKGSLKVTRAFGAGFLKQPKWNNALLEMFRIDYVGTAPYISCHPSLYHYRVGSKDKFLILSSDGLYQYLTNEEAVTQVEMFLSTSPEGDPAQHLIEELLFRAAAKAGLELHELLEIPQGDRRRYYDDVSVIVISLEGRIWRSFV